MENNQNLTLEDFKHKFDCARIKLTYIGDSVSNWNLHTGDLEDSHRIGISFLIYDIVAELEKDLEKVKC